MIRNLKVLIVAAIALMALGAIAASGAHAAEEKFHCSVEPCTVTLKPDGTSTTAHQVIVLTGESIEGVKESTDSFTCNSLSGEFTSPNKTLTTGTAKNIKYNTCKIVGNTFTVDMNSCTYKFNSTGGGTAAGSEVHLECTIPGDGITVTFGSVVCVKITALTTTGIKYHDAAIPPKKDEITAEMSNVAIPKAAVHLENIENSACAAVNLKTVEKATYTTGHTIITGETEALVMASVWFE